MDMFNAFDNYNEGSGLVFVEHETICPFCENGPITIDAHNDGLFYTCNECGNSWSVMGFNL